MSNTHLLSGTSIEKKLKTVDFVETIKHLENVRSTLSSEVPNFRSLMIYQAFKNLEFKLKKLKTEDIIVLSDFKIWSLLYIALDEINKNLKNSNTNYFEYDRYVNLINYFIIFFGLNFKIYSDKARNRLFVSYYRDFVLGAMPFRRTTSAMYQSKEYVNKDGKLDEKKSQEHAQHLFFHNMIQTYVSKFYPEDEKQMRSNNAMMTDFGDVYKKSKIKGKNIFIPKHKTRPKGLRTTDPNKKEK